MADQVRQNEETATQRRARLLGFDYVDTSHSPHKQIYPGIMSVDQMRALRVLPVQADRYNNTFAITTTTPQNSIRDVSVKYNDQRNVFVLISDSGFREYLDLYDPPKQIVYQDIELKNAGNDALIEQISTILNQINANDMLAYLVSQAHRLSASDIHIETERNDVRIRFRIDGVLHIIARIDRSKYRILIAAIASAGNISTSDSEAQQGHISQKVKMADENEVDVNVRLETVPTINGMDVVMRLFNMDAETFRLEHLGLSDKETAVVDQIISKPAGMVMVVGPTGSGKTTTLYSILNSLNSFERKIITIEDPVEYQFPGITQIPVKSAEDGSGSVFAEKLRAVLRLDPDIVMVGEVRDSDTARTALQAALTGHLVLTTFHAGSAAAALTRLADVIGQNPLFVSAIRLIMAQRLIRRLDDSSKIAYEPTAEQLETISRVVDNLPPGQLKPALAGLKLYKPGRSDNNPYGFSGQLAIREQLQITEQIKQIITSPSRVVSTADIETAAIAGGMLTMMQDAILKVVAGTTTLEEIYRVID